MRTCVLWVYLCLALSGCELMGGRTGGGTETETAGTLYYPDGTLAVNASVIARPADYLADSLLTSEQASLRFSVKTDAKGRFRIARLPLGAYRLEAQSGLRRGLIKDFVLEKEGQRIAFKPDTLRLNGSILGRIVDSTGARGGHVQVFGLERLVNADTATGTFMLNDLAPGTYDIRCIGLGAFRKQAHLGGLVVKSGETLTLDDIVLEEVPKLTFKAEGGALTIEGVDTASPVIFDNEFWDNGPENEYIWAKASTGILDLRGNIVTDAMRKNQVTVDAQLTRAKIELRTATLAGFRNLIEPVEGSRHPLLAASSGRIEDIAVDKSFGSELIVAEALKATPERPLTVIAGGPLTTVANAYLTNPAIASRMVVLAIYPFSINSADSLAAYVVAKRCRLAVWGRDYVWTGALDSALLAKLPGSRLGERLRASTLNSARGGNASFGDIAPAAWLVKPSLWTAAGLFRLEPPLQVQAASGLSFDFLDIPKAANDWRGFQEEFFASLGEAEAYQPVKLPGVLEAEGYGARAGARGALTAVGSAPDTAQGDAMGGTAGASLEWKVAVDSAGTLRLKVRHRSPAGGRLTVTSGDALIGHIILPAGPEWTETGADLSLAAGSQTLRVTWAQGAFELDRIKAE